MQYDNIRCCWSNVHVTQNKTSYVPVFQNVIWILGIHVFKCQFRLLQFPDSVIQFLINNKQTAYVNTASLTKYFPRSTYSVQWQTQRGMSGCIPHRWKVGIAFIVTWNAKWLFLHVSRYILRLMRKTPSVVHQTVWLSSAYVMDDGTYTTHCITKDGVMPKPPPPSHGDGDAAQCLHMQCMHTAR